MKKLMIAAAIVCAAAVSHAASIQWGGDIAASSDGEDAVGAGSVAYLIRGATAAEAAVATIYVDGTEWSAWTTDTGAKIVGSHTLTSAEAGTNYRFEPLYNITGDADAGYYSVVVVDGQAGAVGLTGAYAYGGQNSVVDPTSGALTDLTIGDNWATDGAAGFIGQKGYSSVSFAAIPEPTSGLLMLLGFAGLALRRRRA